MSRCTPDTAASIRAVAADLRSLGFQLRISDLFRSYEMQKQAHLDYLTGRKKAYSPPPGGSMHECGRAVDIDLGSIGVPLKQFWDIVHAHGLLPLIDVPDSRRSEAWHFDCRGSHGRVYDYARQGRAGLAAPPYTHMSRSGIIAIGERLDSVPDQGVAFAQSALIRLGLDPGPIDGIPGDRTLAALREAGCDAGDADGICRRLRERFPEEWSDPEGENDAVN